MQEGGCWRNDALHPLLHILLCIVIILLTFNQNWEESSNSMQKQPRVQCFCLFLINVKLIVDQTTFNVYQTTFNMFDQKHDFWSKNMNFPIKHYTEGSKQQQLLNLQNWLPISKFLYQKYITNPQTW